MNAGHRGEGSTVIPRHLAWALAPLAVCLALYLPSLDSPFLWDDESMLGRSLATARPESLPAALATPYLGVNELSISETPFYRPLSQAALLGERIAFGRDPLGFRAVHALLHLANALLLFVAARRLFAGADAPEARHSRGAAIAASLFAALPYGADAVLFLTDLGDPMALCFALLTLVAFERARARPSPAALAAVFLASAGAALSKETGVVVPALLAARHFLFGAGGGHRPAAWGIAVSSAAVAGYLALRTSILGSPAIDPLEALARLPADLALALRWALAPHPLALEEHAPGGVLGAWWWAGLIASAAAVAAAVSLRRRSPTAALSIVCWAALVLPSLLVLHGTGVFAPRYLYAPGAALALLPGLAASRGRSVRRLAGIGIVVAAGLLAAIRVHAWSDDIHLWSLEVERHPDSAPALVNLGLALQRRDRVTESLAIQERAALAAEESGNPIHLALALSNAGYLAAWRLGDPDRALRLYERAVRAFPGHAGSWQAIGTIHARDGSWDRAEQAFRRAVEAAPGRVDAIEALAGALAAQGLFDEAFEHLDSARRLAAADLARLAEVERKIRVVRAREAAARSTAREGTRDAGP